MYTYLLVDLLILAIPLALSFYKKVTFFKEWRFVWQGMLLNLLIFLSWDIAFSVIGVWGFNPEYHLGMTLFHLPLEEYLFLLVVPYTGIFVYSGLEAIFSKDILFRFRKIIAWLVVFGALTIYFFHTQNLYTSTASLYLAFGMLMILLSGKHLFLGRFFMTYLLLLVPFLIFNGILTALPVVWYNDAENMGVRLFSIPFDNLLYFMGMLLIPLGLYARLSRK